jgi:hypothetical protein
MESTFNRGGEFNDVRLLKYQILHDPVLDDSLILFNP